MNTDRRLAIAHSTIKHGAAGASLRRFLLAGVSIPAILLVAMTPRPANAGAPPPLSPAWFAAKAAAGGNAPAAAAIGGQPTPASLQNVQQTIQNLSKAAQAIAAMQAAQGAARAAAVAAPHAVPNGLAPGGLQPVAGYADPNGGVWLNAHLPSVPQTNVNGRIQVTVTQTAPKAVLNWTTFNVGANTTLNFDQSAGGTAASTWSVVNRVKDPAAQPSQILGAISAPGHVYVINHNGIIFGAGAQINVNALIASTADMTDGQFNNNGIYSVPSSTDPSGYTASFTNAGSAAVIVQAGAQLVTNGPTSVVDGGGSIMLLGGRVQNDGTILTPNGQTILAAGQSFILRPGYSVSGTDSNGLPTGNVSSTTLGSEIAVTSGGAVTNTGLIQATTGDITMVGQAVTQSGVAIATTSVARRGTVHLLTDTTDTTASVTLAPSSVTLIVPDANSGTALNSQRAAAITDSAAANGAGFSASKLNDQARSITDRQDQSRVEITTGGTVDFQGNSLTIATGGQVAVSAGSIFAESGAAVDVAGSAGVTLPMSANNVVVNIQGFELRDAPVNRDTTTLFNSNVPLDLRQLTLVPASSAYPTDRYYSGGGLIEASGAVSNIYHTIGEWTAPGGTITFVGQSVVTQPGSILNLAGGYIQYQSGYLQTAWLKASNGQIYNANNAPASLTYTGVYSGFTVNHPRWNFTQTFNTPLIGPTQIWQNGYVVGRSAGTLVINAPSVLMEGTIQAGVVDGQGQSAAPSTSTTDPFLQPQNAVPIGGSLLIGSFNGGSLLGGVAANVVIGDGSSVTGALSPDAALPAALTGLVSLSAAQISASGLATLQVAVGNNDSSGSDTVGAVSISAPLTLSPGGNLTIVGAVTTISAPVTAPGAAVTIGDVFTTVAKGLSVGTPTINGVASVTLTSTGALNTRGLWTNALLDPTNVSGLAFINGGSVSLLSTQGLTLQAGSVIDTSSGGAVTSSGALKGGAGGSVSLMTDELAAYNGSSPGTSPIVLDETLRANGVSGGGTLTILVPAALIANNAPANTAPANTGSANATAAAPTLLQPAFFQQGFSKYVVNAWNDLTNADGTITPAISVAPGTVVNVVERVYQLSSASTQVPTGSDPASAFTVGLLPTYTANAVTAKVTQRPGASLSLTALGRSSLSGPLVNASVSIGAGATVTVDPGQSVSIQSNAQTTVDGTIRAPGGAITFTNSRPLDAAAGGPKVYNFLVPGISTWIGAQAVLDVSAQAFTATDQLGRSFGVVPAGGSITIGGGGTVVFIRPGAVLDASGASAVIDLNAGLSPAANSIVAARGGAASDPVEVDSNGGTISLNSTGGIYIDGMLRAAAGGPTASGGTLSLTLQTPIYGNASPSSVPTNIPDVIRVPYELIVSQIATPTPVPADLQPGDGSIFTTASGLFGKAAIGVDQITAGGFGNVSLTATDMIMFNGLVTLSAAQSIRLAAGEYVSATPSGGVTIKAPYVLFSGSVPDIQPDAPVYSPTVLGNVGSGAPFSKLTPPCISGAAVCSSATLTVNADLIDIQNSVNVGGLNATMSLAPTIKNNILIQHSVTVDEPGFNAVNFISNGDIRFLPPNDNNSPGAIVQASGDLSFVAAQLYPVTGATALVRAGLNNFNGTDTGASTPSGNYARGTITIGRISGDVPAVPESAFGALQFEASTIQQGGILRAPWGAIFLGSVPGYSVVSGILGGGATNSVELLPGSITSTSLDGATIPYGGTADGLNYSYNGQSASFYTFGQNGYGIGKGVALGGRSISVSAGATVDISGGGSLSGGGGELFSIDANGNQTLTGQGFISGRGGSTDTLYTPTLTFNGATHSVTIPTLQTNPVYAIVPGLVGPYAPTTSLDQSSSYAGSVPGIGQQITIPAGVSGLPAGTYTLLPSYYALLPGGYRVELNTKASAQLAGPVPLATGATEVAGFLSTANTGIKSNLPVLTLITPRSGVVDSSQYNQTSYAQTGAAQAAQANSPRPMQPNDAQTLSTYLYLPTNGPAIGFTFQGTLFSQAVAGGYGGTLNVESGDAPIEILSPTAAPTSGYVSVRAVDLNATNAATMNIGGTGGVTSTTYYFSGGGTEVLRTGAVLSAPQVFLVGDITIEPGAGINTLGRGAPPFDSNNTPYTYNNSQETVLAVSNGYLQFAPTSFPIGGSSGYINVGACLAGDVCGSGPAVLYSNGTVGFDAAGPVTFAGDVRIGARYLTLAVANINVLGADVAPSSVSVPAGLQLTQSLLNIMLAGDASVGAPALQQLTLQASQSVNLFGNVSLSTINPQTGQSSLQQLVLATPGIYGYGGPGDVATISTGSLIWAGVFGFSPPLAIANGPGSGQGTLNIAASTVTFGAQPNAAGTGAMASRATYGFATVNITGTNGITDNGPGSLSVYQSQGAYQTGSGTAANAGGTLNLITPLLTGGPGSVMAYTAGGAVSVSPPGGTAPGLVGAVAGLGAEIDITGATISDFSTVVLPGGRLMMTARTGDVTLGAGSSVDLSGRTVTFFDQTAYSPGGALVLMSTAGNVVQDPAASIDISATNADAGSISATAMAGTVALNGAILGGATGGHNTGSVSLRTGTLSQAAFDGLNARLNQAGIFGARSFEIGSGSLAIGNDGTGAALLRASTASVALDSGNLLVNGTIDASGNAPGSIALSANGTLHVAAGAVLDAHGNTLQVDSSGTPIDALNAGSVTLTVDAGGNAPTGTLALDGGATINVSAPDGVARGDVELNVPRTGETSGNANISAAGAVTIAGARTVALNAFWTYAPTDANGSIIQNNGDLSGAGVATSGTDKGFVGLNQINAKSQSFMTAAAANTTLATNIAGLIGANFHLRPGVQIESGANSKGNLTVVGDLDLSGYRYSDPSGYGLHVQPATYGSGEPGTLVIRASGNLVVNGSITDGFAKPPATPDDAGWYIYNGAEPNGQSILLPTTITFASPANNRMSLPAGTVPISTDGSGIPVVPATVGVNTLITVASPLTAAATIPAGTVLSADILSSSGAVLAARGTLLTSPLTLPVGAMLTAGTVLPVSVTVQPGGAGGWPSGVPMPFAMLLANTTQKLAAGTFLPAGTAINLSGSSFTTNGLPTRTITNNVQGPVYAVAPMLPAGDLSWSMQFVSGAALGAADTQTVQTTAALQAQASATNPTPGSITLSDLHYMSPRDATLRYTEVFSVIRTGTGNLSLVSGGNFTEDSLYGIYTAGTQAANVSAADRLARPNLPGSSTVLGIASSSANDKIGNVSYASALQAQATAGYQAYYPVNGGNLLISAQGNLGGDTISTNYNSSTNAVGTWLWRQGGNGQDTAWWINFGTYMPNVIQGSQTTTVTLVGATGFGAFGGGNATVQAGNTGLAGTAHVTTAPDVIVASTGRQGAVSGGGALSIDVGGEASLGTLTDMRGSLSVTAGAIGSVAVLSGNPNLNDTRPSYASLGEVGYGVGGPILVLGDANASLTARGDVVLSGVGNPTMQTQIPLNAVLGQQFSGTQPNAQQSWYSLWTPTTSVSLFSTGGNVMPVVQQTSPINDTPTDGRSLYPPILNVAAASGSIFVSASQGSYTAPSSVETAPSPFGQLDLLAMGGIYGQAGSDPYGASRGNIGFAISGADPIAIPTAANPAFLAYSSSARTAQTTNVDPTADISPNSMFAFGPDTPTTNLHGGDPNAALFYAVTGDIVGLMPGETWLFGSSRGGTGPQSTTWYIGGQSVRIRAGRDVVGVGTRPGSVVYADTSSANVTQGLIVNANQTDVSEVIAGRDIIDLNLNVAGPGTLYVQAGHNVNQNSQGVLQSIGPLVGVNPSTRDSGAGITVLAGVGAAGPDWTDFSTLYLDPANLANQATPLQNQPGKVVRNYDQQLFAWLQQRGYAGTEAGALDAFNALPIEQQRTFLLQVYFDELNQAGLDYNDPNSRFYKSYLPGNNAIAALFPTKDASGAPITYSGDLQMYSGYLTDYRGQQIIGSNGKPVVADGGIRTNFGGNITALVPGGQIVVGITGLTPGANAGLLTQGSGNIDLYSSGSVLLGQSRIFTTFGGGILIWSSHGDINAGRGAKTTVVFSPPQISYDMFADVTLSPTVPTTGAGIATLAPIPSIPPGDINLIAPLGTIDAGEAGLRASGNANLAALVIANAANIQVQGKVTGLPVVAVPNVAGETAAAAATGAAQNSAMQSAKAPAHVAPSIITVEILGYGGESDDSKNRRSQAHGG